MANLNKNKGRRAERSAQAYLEYIGGRAIDLHHNDAMESISNADLLWFPRGDIPADPKEAIADGVEVQVKYSSSNSYGFKGIYNRHEREDVSLGKYRKDPDEADLGANTAIWWKRHHPEGEFFSGSLKSAANNIMSLRMSPFEVWVEHKMSKTMRTLAMEYDLVLCRQPRKPWLAVWEK